MAAVKIASNLSPAVLKRLMLARFLYNQALENAKSHREVAGFAAINMLQDSIEIFFLASADFLNADIGKKTDFEQYIDKVNDHLGDNELPFRRRLVEINKVRVLSKHEGIAPNPSELIGYFQVARDFFDQATELIFGRQFWTISLIDLLDEEESKHVLVQAEHEFNDGSFSDCLISCRKVLFAKFEHRFDVAPFQSGQFENALALYGNLSPDHARNREYIANYVKTPFEFIQMDHNRMTADLLKDGIDPEVFWNICRLTPSVYRRSGKAAWLVKNDLHKHDEEGLKERASYVLENTIDIVLKLNTRFRAVKSVVADRTFVVNLKNTGTIIYSKADLLSQPVGAVPDGVTELRASYGTPSFDGEGYFWRVMYVKDDLFLLGYVSEADVDR
jgi:hypothetical protein